MLTIDLERGCTGLIEPDGTFRYAIWPVGAVLLTDPLRIEFADGTFALPGDSLVGAGGVFHELFDGKRPCSAPLQRRRRGCALQPLLPHRRDAPLSVLPPERASPPSPALPYPPPMPLPSRHLLPLLLPLPLLLAACGGGSDDDPRLPPPFFLTAQFDVEGSGQAPDRSTLTWWYDEPGHWRYDLESGAHEGEPPDTFTVFGAGDSVVTRNGDSEDRIELGQPAQSRLFSSLFLGPVEGRTVREFIAFLEDLSDSDVTIVGQDVVLGRTTTLIEVRPAVRGAVTTATPGGSSTSRETAGGSIRYWLDPSIMLVLRAELDSDDEDAFAEVTALDLTPTFPADPFFDPDA